MLPDWLLNEDAAGLPIRALRLGEAGVHKSINLGVRRGDENTSCDAARAVHPADTVFDLFSLFARHGYPTSIKVRF